MNLHRYFNGILKDNVIASKIFECYFIEVNATDFMKNRRLFDYSDLDECATGTHNYSADAECNNSKGSFNCTCKLGYSGNVELAKTNATDSTTRSIHDMHIQISTSVLLEHMTATLMLCASIQRDRSTVHVNVEILEMEELAKRTFHYDSGFWSNNVAYNLPGGETGFDTLETKLPTYWNTSFSKICLGMTINEQLRFIVINRQANSLYSLIADGQYCSTSLGRDTWKSLIGSQGSLQAHCNKEGFNLEPEGAFWKNKGCKARIGILTNNQNNCGDVESRIGFGTGGPRDDNNTCGIDATGLPLDNGERRIKAMGYILVQ
ncbi:hypothetical protein AWC38_SpisGene12934 [Stylophora pistillata]|uniref:EGF-like domain-containing protein n=1 Tax=Stylophora pistillata TaxID=50429 RepID=A0A2B4RZE6_STYPI|nr:hypothetical protein AWC38_SpisGene12934 [Stylophora pistillata]